MKFVLFSALLALSSTAFGQVQAPANASLGAPISSSDRIYTGDQSSNTVTVINPSTNEVLGTIALGDSRLTDVIGPQYIKAVNSHGLGFSRDGKYIVSLSVTSNTVTVIRTNDNKIISQTFTDRQPHEAFFAADNRTLWVGTRGTDHISLVDGLVGGVIGTIPSYGGPSKGQNGSEYFLELEITLNSALQSRWQHGIRESHSVWIPGHHRRAKPKVDIQPHWSRGCILVGYDALC